MSQKIENQLNLALSITEEERQKSESLDIGYDLEEKEWELIVKYSGTLERVRTRAVYVTELTGGYAIIQIKESQIKELAAFPEVEFIEKPKSLYFQIENGRRVSCIDEVQAAPFFSSIGQEGLEDNQQKKQSFPLLGKDVLIGIVDSGIDYENPDFRNADGTTRILALWDQTLQNGKPPQEYHIGTEFTSEQINEALRMEVREERYRIVPSRDTSGHGTAVAGIAAGNGRGSKNGKYRGAAPEAGLLIVKMGGAGETGFPRTTQLMRGVDYIVRKAEELKKPVAINISFGNTYGSHDGTSLLERYLNTVSERWKNVICVGSGNEGTTAGHAAGEYRKGMMTEVQLAVQQREKSFSLQIWKSYVDEVAITIVDPSGNHSGRLEEKEGTQRIQIGETELLVYYGEPKPYSIRQEIYISFQPRNEFVTAGVWKIQMMPGQVVDKLWQMWLPVQNALNIGTAFLKPDSSTTLTIPSTASLVITVAAYNALTFSYADFSGRGPAQIYEGENANKPDLAAPGVRVMAPVAGGGYAEFTGTSFATPFVTGSAALLMEWGIVKGNDPYLYGEKVKAYLRRGARQIPGYERWPNGELGYGRLCIVQSIPGM
ncbi:S8 family peptidase [Mediterraneibacter faecis]|uniref:S8 family peptidase n=1 Tax=Mediterraneibacter faecis TaxID=592978 RepID=UPI003CE89393